MTRTVTKRDGAGYITKKTETVSKPLSKTNGKKGKSSKDAGIGGFFLILIGCIILGALKARN